MVVKDVACDGLPCVVADVGKYWWCGLVRGRLRFVGGTLLLSTSRARAM